MKLSEQVCSLYLSKRLKELGVSQKSYAEWLYMPEGDFWMVFPQFENTLSYAAFTVSELGKMLPYQYITEKVRGAYYTDKKMIDYWLCYNSAHGVDKPSTQMEINEADARAKMLIYLIENRLISVGDKE